MRILNRFQKLPSLIPSPPRQRMERVGVSFLRLIRMGSKLKMKTGRASIKYLIVIIILLSSCNKNDLFDFVVGGQPTFVGDHKYVPGLNIFAVIRPDSTGTESMSLINIEKVLPAISNVQDSFSVAEFSFVMYIMNKDIIRDSLSFNYNYPDTIFTHKPYNSEFKPGVHFKIICKSPGLPVLRAEAIMPNQPVLADSIIYSNNKIQFSIAADSSAFLYDVYVITTDNQYKHRVLRVLAGNTKVEVDAEISVNSGAKVLIYAYDKNLSEYLTAANLFYKPNTYRPPFTTVQNGYGCFGAMNLLVKKVIVI